MIQYVSERIFSRKAQSSCGFLFIFTFFIFIIAHNLWENLLLFLFGLFCKIELISLITLVFRLDFSETARFLTHYSIFDISNEVINLLLGLLNWGDIYAIFLNKFQEALFVEVATVVSNLKIDVLFPELVKSNGRILINPLMLNERKITLAINWVNVDLDALDATGLG